MANLLYNRQEGEDARTIFSRLLQALNFPHQNLFWQNFVTSIKKLILNDLRFERFKCFPSWISFHDTVSRKLFAAQMQILISDEKLRITLIILDRIRYLLGSKMSFPALQGFVLGSNQPSSMLHQE